jgi:hypothetical protein
MRRSADAQSAAQNRCLPDFTAAQARGVSSRVEQAFQPNRECDPARDLQLHAEPGAEAHVKARARSGAGHVHRAEPLQPTVTHCTDTERCQMDAAREPGDEQRATQVAARLEVATQRLRSVRFERQRGATKPQPSAERSAEPRTRKLTERSRKRGVREQVRRRWRRGLDRGWWRRRLRLAARRSRFRKGVERRRARLTGSLRIDGQANG